MSESDRTLLTGWGRTAATAAAVVRPVSEEQVRTAVLAAGPRGVLARGLGRSYGDAAQDAGGTVLDLAALDSLHIDATTGVASCGAGVSVDRLIRAAAPLGWFVPVTPGTRQVTIGGAVAADVHGKNHHVAGSFGRHVRSLRLVGAGADAQDLTGDEPAAVATTGGMGLTGVLTRADVQLREVTSSWMCVETTRAGDLDDLMTALIEADGRHPYSVAWIDCLSRGRHLGRGIVTAGRHAARDELPAGRRPNALRLAAPRTVQAPPWAPGGLLNPFTVAAFNEAWFRKAPAHRTDEMQRLETFFHPLDGVQGWNRMYGRGGFVQYQFVVPFERDDVLRRAITDLAAARVASFLAVLKRFGPGSGGPLSFPQPGWTLALDLPARTGGLAALLDRLDELVAGAGGRVYLAKDSRLRPELLAAMYPRLDEWRELRARIDPHRRFVSDLARRLDL